MTVTINSISNEFFSQIDSLVAFVGSDDKGNKAIDENFMLDSNTIIHNFARYLYKQAEQYIDAKSVIYGAIGGFVSVIMLNVLFCFVIY